MRLPFQRNNPQPLRSDAFLSCAMDAWGDTVYRVALAQTGSPSDADDVYQDVFMRLLEHEAPFDNDEHLKAWLIRVTINRCRDLTRLAWNRRTEGLERELASIPAPDAFRADIWDVVGALSPCTCSTWRATPPRKSPALRSASPARYAPGCIERASSCARRCKPSVPCPRANPNRERS